MISRFTGSMLGLFAFGVSTVVGLAAGNPATVVLTRALWALVVFCAVGLAIGAAAQAVINEFIACQSKALDSTDNEQTVDGALDKSTPSASRPMGTE